jgi:hypothetical protein
MHPFSLTSRSFTLFNLFSAAAFFIVYLQFANCGSKRLQLDDAVVITTEPLPPDGHFQLVSSGLVVESATHSVYLICARHSFYNDRTHTQRKSVFVRTKLDSEEPISKVGGVAIDPVTNDSVPLWSEFDPKSDVAVLPLTQKQSSHLPFRAPVSQLSLRNNYRMGSPILVVGSSNAIPEDDLRLPVGTPE